MLKDDLFYTKDRDEYQRVIVKAAANDNYLPHLEVQSSSIRDAYIQHLSQISDLRMDERSSSNCILYMNGRYWGYMKLEKRLMTMTLQITIMTSKKTVFNFKPGGGLGSNMEALKPRLTGTTSKLVLSNPMNMQQLYNCKKPVQYW